MARILVIDGNPDTHRSLGGLLKYRTSHTVDMVETCQAGVRRAVTMNPDVVMINALLFMANNYAFPRVMQKHPETAGIAFVVHSVGDLDEMTRKQIEASGVARAVELPISAGELEAEIAAVVEKGEASRRSAGGVQPVQWARVAEVEPQAAKSDRGIRPVQWPTASRAQTPKRARSTPKKKEAASNAFQAYSDAPPPAQKPSFRASTFESVRPEEAGRVKNESGGKFHEQRWSRVDPKQVKPRERKRP